MATKRPIKVKIYARAVTAIFLIITWALITLTGIVVYVAPSGFRSGRESLLFGFDKATWNDIHFWIGVVVVAVTIIHMIIDWRALRGVIRYLTSAHRRPEQLPR